MFDHQFKAGQFNYWNTEHATGKGVLIVKGTTAQHKDTTDT